MSFMSVVVDQLLSTTLSPSSCEDPREEWEAAASDACVCQRWTQVEAGTAPRFLFRKNVHLLSTSLVSSLEFVTESQKPKSCKDLQAYSSHRLAT